MLDNAGNGQDPSKERVRGWLVSQVENLAERCCGMSWNSNSEAGRAILEWLANDICGVPVVAEQGWLDRLRQAVELGQQIFLDFCEVFSDLYGSLDGRGAQWVRLQLARRHGFADDLIVETVLDRIHDRRVWLMTSFFSKYQGSLFANRKYRPERLPGYFRRVAQIESYHCLRGVRVTHVDPARYGETLSDIPRRQAEEIGNIRDWGQRLAEFWTVKNGFSPQQQLEGLVSVGLGFLTDNRLVADRCRDLMQDKLPDWETRGTQLRRRASRLLARWEDVREMLKITWDPVRRDDLTRQLWRLEDDRRRVERQILDHPTTLRPKPWEVQKLLEGEVANVGNARFRRIYREIEIMGERVGNEEAGRQAVGKDTASEVIRGLVVDIRQHLDQRPPSSSAHGLSPQEKQFRTAAERGWFDAGAELWSRISEQLRISLRDDALRPGLQARLQWLSDAEMLYAFGVQTRQGVLGALGRRHGWRVKQLLRLPGQSEEIR